jgi:hypothetical protein
MFKSIKPIWVVVEVKRGITISVEAFWDKPSAEKHKKILSTHYNPEDDEISVYRLRVHKNYSSNRLRMDNPKVVI